ncbi:D-TA family PLP-dependent enzyme [Echinicola strongylocentroti]|uniref:D-TA family PLP-dependent enzyme n=1 Tax=Echinicola strongylocentroti TaxID=1795355 RepID=A0A2Z4ILT8_9BACT|nr:D-TA family PLP-dependent enzyme [Echinicola strongylocentroti]AWW31526.1 D-TA family PLP-dependent enzyme [Echinicola strongylocentroti]
MDWYEIKDVETIDSPTLVVYPKRVKSNIGKLKSMVKEVSQLQPHIKTFKCIEVVKMLMDAGIDKFKCATIAEAEILGMAGAKEVLIAYPMVGPKVDRMIKLMLVYQDTEFSCLVDCPEQARHLSAQTYQADVYLRVFVDLNVGTDRTGVRPLAEAMELYDYCKATSHLITMGLHIYDGHIRHRELGARKEACDAAFTPVEELAKAVREKYPVKLKIIAGGSPTFPIHALRKGVTCSPGTFAYWDKGYQEGLPEQSFDFAAVLVCRVISRPGPRLICLDLGYKSVASEGPLEKRVWFPAHPSWVPVSHSEEHLVLKVPEGEEPTIGEVVYGIPYHICPTVAMYDRVLTVENHQISGCWDTVARKRKINI